MFRESSQEFGALITNFGETNCLKYVLTGEFFVFTSVNVANIMQSDK
jgi:hypothetical protein